jgi:hypothetical protein
MQQDTSHLWQLALKHAITEADPRLARAKIETAEVAIFHRIHAFTTGTNTLEEQALFDALDTIRRLKASAARPLPAPQKRKRTRGNYAMNAHIKGCGKDDLPLTLYCLSSGSLPSPISGGYWHVRCGYRPPSKIKNGILLCDVCVAKLALPSLRDLPRDSAPIRADLHEPNHPPPSQPHALP